MSVTDLPPPRYFSVDMRDPENDIGPRLRIFLDGVEQNLVTAYDCNHGWIDRLVQDKDGKPALTPDRERLKSERVKGNVTAEWQD